MPNFEILYMEHPSLKQDLIFKNCILYSLISWNFLPTVLSNIIHVPLCFLWKDLIPFMFLSCPPRFLIRFLFWALVRSSHKVNFLCFIYKNFFYKTNKPLPRQYNLHTLNFMLVVDILYFTVSTICSLNDRSYSYIF